MKGHTRTALYAFFCLSVGCLLALAFFLFQFFYVGHDIKEAKFIIVEKGDNVCAISKKLAASITGKNGKTMCLLSKILYRNHSIIAGEYMFLGKFTYSDLYKKMFRGDVFYRKITFAEGLTVKQILDKINSTEYLQGALDQSVVLEGSLLPETYYYTAGEEKSAIVSRMQAAMKEALAQAWQKRSPNITLKDQNELLILASIVEKETGLTQERAKIASVFHNRIQKGMKLQSDPTTIYEITRGQYTLNKGLTKHDLHSGTVYNTYIISGLPPTPISCPSKEAIFATANPETTNYLYFVANNKGGHNFSATLQEHNLYVQEYRKSTR